MATITATTEAGVPRTRSVDTPSGRLRGSSAGGIASFLGIRYGEAPVGARRFRPPVPAEPWSGERDALEFGASAVQPKSALAIFPGPRDEDCLFLNVWAPDTGEPTLAAGDRRPVMVWFHGGGFTSGSSSIAWYDGARLADRGVIVVTVNYRLGPLGFCHLEAIGGREWQGAANLGLADQALALQWVRGHAASFGGDPDNVTIFGESAGAMSVSSHLALPASRGLFRRAIAQSGAARHIHTSEAGERVARAVLDAVGVSAPQGLLDVDAAVFAEIQADLVSRDRATLPLPFMPTIDGTTLPVAPEPALAEGIAAGIELICGTNSEEMRLFTLLARVSGGLD
ncbi:MAG TPA: carboxylesterase family protein, partial [Microthrixaceae bacterium]|nr:carboxylesterase family protein [Microthrixaceae bacterium]